MDTAEADVQKARKDRDEAQNKYAKLKTEKAPKSQINEAVSILNRAKWNLERSASEFRSERRAYKEVRDVVDAITAKFQKQGIKPEKMDAVLKGIAANIAKMKGEVEKLDSQFDVYVREAQRKIEAAKVKLPPLSEQIKLNVRSIMDDLRPMEDVKKEILKQREQTAAGMKKSFVFYKGKIFVGYGNLR
jgi:uncharacterized coiled-coil DUF342 family protein